VVVSRELVEAYERDGFVVVEGVFSAGEVARLGEVTEEFVERSRLVSEHSEVFDLEPSHSAAEPRVRRVKDPHRLHGVYGQAVRHPVVLEVVRELIGPAVKFDGSKLNMKAAGGGSPVEWHQDWAFYPHTNEDLCAVGIMLDDCGEDNGPLMVVPGSHRGPVYDHHAGGRFCGAIDVAAVGLDLSTARPCLGRAGSMSVHHVRAVHGSAPNVSGRPRRLLLPRYRAADAWPLLPPRSLLDGQLGFEEYQQSGLVCGGCDPVVVRMSDSPVRLPLPAAEHEGSIYEKQRGMQNRYFDQPTTTT
jgi:ectoine hydroxylase-related dioxygenase (phytanoyl-CoA dioxygenase family)